MAKQHAGTHNQVAVGVWSCFRLLSVDLASLSVDAHAHGSQLGSSKRVFPELFLSPKKADIQIQ